MQTHLQQDRAVCGPLCSKLSEDAPWRSNPNAAGEKRPRPQLVRFCALRAGSAVRMRISAQGSCRGPRRSHASAAQLLNHWCLGWNSNPTCWHLEVQPSGP